MVSICDQTASMQLAANNKLAASFFVREEGR
jgi:hypothetical protein